MTQDIGHTLVALPLLSVTVTCGPASHTSHWNLPQFVPQGGQGLFLRGLQLDGCGALAGGAQLEAPSHCSLLLPHREVFLCHVETHGHLEPH